MKFSKEQLEKELEEIDAFLRKEGVPIPGRPIRATCEFSKKHKIGLPITTPVPGTRHESYQYWPITQFIKQWFDDRYGGRLGMDAGPGKCAFLLKGDPWFFHYPKFFGSYIFALSREHSSEELPPLDGIHVYNVFESIRDLPNGLRKSTTDNELQYLLDTFCLGLWSLTTLERICDDELIKSARADIEATVTHIMSSRSEFGLAKWSSLQAAEKYLKYLLKSKGNKIPKTHHLIELTEKLNDLGVNVDITNEVNNIQCNPSIRYGETKISLEDAINAHHASLSLILKLKDEVK